MSDAQNLFTLLEVAAGYALFEVVQMEEIGSLLEANSSSVTDMERFGRAVKLKGFQPFESAQDALENANAISEHACTDTLRNFLEMNLPKIKKKKEGKSAPFALGVVDPGLATAISEALPGLSCRSDETVREVLRGCRLHLTKMVKGLDKGAAEQAQLGLGHSYSRGKVKFNPARSDNMIIQSIALLDQMDKDLNTFAMRVREWYSWHFPELKDLVKDNYMFARCAAYIQDKNSLCAKGGGGDDDDDEEDLAKLTSAPPADADASLSGPTEPPRSLLRWDAASNTWVTLASAADGSELSAEIDVSASTKAKAPPPATADGKGLASIAEGDEEMSRATSPADTRLKSSRAATAAAGGGAKERRLKAKKKKRPMDPAHLDARRRLADPDSWFVPGADEPQSGMGVARHAPAPAPPPLLPPSGVGGSRPRPLAPYLRQSAALAAQPEELRRVEDSVPLDDILPAMQGFDLEIDADAVGGEPLSSPPPRDLEAFPAGGQAGGSIDDALGQHWQMSTNHDESPPPAEEVSPYMMRDNALFDDDELEMTREEGEEESNNEDSGASTSAPPPPPFPWMQQEEEEEE